MPRGGHEGVVITITVAHWGTGPLGRLALRGILADPDLRLVALGVHDESKRGRDAAELSGPGDFPVGVAATTSLDDLLDAQPQCLTWFGRGQDRAHTVAADLVPFLAAGVNVVTTALPTLLDPHCPYAEVREPLERAAAEGGASLLCTGMALGFATDVLPLALLAGTKDVDEVRISHVLDLGGCKDRRQLERHDLGLSRAELDERDPASRAGEWVGAASLIVASLGGRLDDVTAASEIEVSERDLDHASGPIPTGTVTAVRHEILAVTRSRARVAFEQVARADPAAAPGWTSGRAGSRSTVRVEMTGRPTMHVELGFDDPQADDPTLLAGAMRAVQVIPAVVASHRSLLSPLDLPIVSTHHLAG